MNIEQKIDDLMERMDKLESAVQDLQAYQVEKIEPYIAGNDDVFSEQIDEMFKKINTQINWMRKKMESMGYHQTLPEMTKKEKGKPVEIEEFGDLQWLMKKKKTEKKK